MKNLKEIQLLERGAYGIVGMTTTEPKTVFKLTQGINFYTLHEYNVMKRLAGLPHFCRLTDYLELPVASSRDKRNRGHIFDVSDEDITTADILFMEYIPDSISLYDMIMDVDVPFEHIMSVIYRVLIAIQIAQENAKFVHYDLHSKNVLIRRVSNDVDMYNIDDREISIKTYGYSPVIIDFGFSTCDSLTNLFGSYGFANLGYLSPMYDPVADAKLFLITVRNDMEKRIKYKSKNSADTTYEQRFCDAVYEIFMPLSVHWDTGRDVGDKSCVVYDLTVCLKFDENKSVLFSRYARNCVELLFGLVRLPLSYTAPSYDISDEYQGITSEFYKIENIVKNSYNSLFILKKIIECVCDRHTPDAIKSNIESLIGADLNHINFKRMIKHMISFSKCIGFETFQRLESIMIRKTFMYKNLQFKSLVDIYDILRCGLEND